MKLTARFSTQPARRRSPCGERGLKCIADALGVEDIRSLPVRGAWIEMADAALKMAAAMQSLPVRGAWIEMARA